MISTELYAAHVRALEAAYASILADAGFDAVAIHSGTPKKRSEYDDQYWPLRPVPHFGHWVALAEPDAFVVVEPGRRTRLVWPKCTSFWERPPAPESMAFLDVLEVSRDDRPTFSTGQRTAFIGEDAARAEQLGLKDVNPPKLLAALDALRTRKTAYEVACLAVANERAARGHEALRRAFAEGDLSELDLHLLYLGATRQDDWETPYKNIVALGPSGAILHHVSYGRATSGSQSLLVDAGARCLGYDADITRTWVKPEGPHGATFAALVAAMEALQKRLVGQIAHGMPYEQLHDASHLEVSRVLRDAGLAKGSPEEICAAGVSRAFYPHGLGHSLGLQTHDVGCAVIQPRADNPFLRNTSKIAPQQVFTIEPGLYFIAPLLAELESQPAGKLVDWQLTRELAVFGGIRIEDDIVVTDGGIRNLTREVLPVGGGLA